MNKHTDGPWSDGYNITGDLSIWDSEGNNLLHSESPLEREEREANARLMAAAPGLLAVLRDAAAMLPVAARLHPSDLHDLQSRVTSAIAKAMGENT